MTADERVKRIFDEHKRGYASEITKLMVEMELARLYFIATLHDKGMQQYAAGLGLSS